MMKYFKSALVGLLISSQALAGLPPTTSKGVGDSSGVVTFNYQFPSFAITHTGPTASLGVLGIGGGGTGQITKAPAFDALSPMTTGGDLIYGGASGTATRLPNGTANQLLQSNGTTLAPTWVTTSLTAIRSQIRVEGSGAGAAGYGSTNTVIRRFLTTVNSTGTDITYADSATLGGTFTANVAGLYFMSYSDRDSAGSGNPFGISKNSTQLTTSINSITNTARIAIAAESSTTGASTCSALEFLQVGDVIRAHNDVGHPDFTGVQTSFSIIRVGI